MDAIDISKLSDDAVAVLRATAFRYGIDDLNETLQGILSTYYSLCPWWSDLDQVKAEAGKWLNGERNQALKMYFQKEKVKCSKEILD